MPRLVTGDDEEAGRVPHDALAKGHEGVMVKALDAPYEAGRRGASWIKVKPRTPSTSSSSPPSGGTAAGRAG